MDPYSILSVGPYPNSALSAGQIADFAVYATHHTGYDVIDFANDEFTSYTGLQTHMAQVGKDVVITLDATDDIVLIGTKLTQLATHDFLFT